MSAMGSLLIALQPSSCCWRSTREQVEYQRFLTELSERPGSDFAISAHLQGANRAMRDKLEARSTTQVRGREREDNVI